MLLMYSICSKAHTVPPDDMTCCQATALVNLIYCQLPATILDQGDIITTTQDVTPRVSAYCALWIMSQQQKKPAAAKKQQGHGNASNAAQKPTSAKDRERQQEAQKAAQKSLELQNKAKELISAAAAAGDPEERQKLLQQALDKEIEAETFGKTARYLNTGSFQGLCAGAGLGGGIGVALGTLTGTLVRYRWAKPYLVYDTR